jgi:hypothetical protein
MGDVGGEWPQELAGTGALDLQAGQFVGDRLDDHVEPARRGPEMITVFVAGGEGPHATLAHVEHRGITHHPPLTVAERRVADLAGLETTEVLREDVVSGAEGVPTPKLPLSQGREIPDPDVLPDGVVLARRVPEVVRPQASLPLHELGAGPPERMEEGRTPWFGRHQPRHTDTSPKMPASQTVPRRA